MLKLKINGTDHAVDVDPAMPLLWVLRDELQMTGTKFGCGVGACGACTVHVDGEPVRSCSTPVSSVVGKSVTTIEGLVGRIAHTLQSAWIEDNVPQCGYCQSGQIMTAAALMAKNPNPSDREIEVAMEGNLCRCGTYQRIKRAIRSASKAMQANGGKS